MRDGRPGTRPRRLVRGARIVAAVAAVSASGGVGLVVHAAPAVAAISGFTVTDPPNDPAFTDPNAILTTTRIPVRGSFTVNCGTRHLDLAFGRIGTGESAAGAYDLAASNFDLQSPDLIRNGHWKLVATATNDSGGSALCQGQTAAVARSFRLQRQPAPVTGLAVSVNSDRTVAVRWARNTEPDLVRYIVGRRIQPATSFAAIADIPAASATSYVDSTLRDTGGTADYRLLAVREGADTGTEVASDPSEATATVAAPPSTSSTSTTPGQGSSSSNVTAPRSTTLTTVQPGARAGTTNPLTVILRPSGSPTLKGPDLRAYADALNQTTASSLADGTYEATLPYRTLPADETEGDGPRPEAALGPRVAGETRVPPLFYPAAALALLAFVSHLLFLRARLRTEEAAEMLDAATMAVEPAPWTSSATPHVTADPAALSDAPLAVGRASLAARRATLAGAHDEVLAAVPTVTDRPLRAARRRQRASVPAPQPAPPLRARSSRRRRTSTPPPDSGHDGTS